VAANNLDGTITHHNGAPPLTSVWTFYRFSCRLGPRWFLRGVELTRGKEWPAALSHSGLREGDSVLDIGSAAFSLFPLYLATRGSYKVNITDISENVKAHERTLRARGFTKVLDEGRVTVEVQDARRLTYPDGSFNRVFAISTIEHIGGDGDTQAVKEFARVLRPGGRAVITVPCGPSFQEEQRDTGELQGYGADAGVRDLFKSKRTGTKAFFQYRYDLAAIEARLIAPSGLKPVHHSYVTVRQPDIRQAWGARPAWLKALTNWATPAFTTLLIAVRPAGSPVTKRTEAAIIVLEKPGQGR